MEEVKNNIENLLKSVDATINWANGHENEMAKKSLLNGVKGIRRSLNTIKGSVEKRPSIAIFGQSQVGKSYLVQNLIKPETSKLLKIKVSKDHSSVNFLTEMNPDGGRESTGLVTRFTTADKAGDSTHPFILEIFGQLDIAAILLNSYWSDLKEYDYFDVFEVTENAKDKLSQLQLNEPSNDISEDDVFFFIHYVKENFKDLELFKAFQKSGLLDEILQKLHLIPSDKRWEILNFFWGKNKFITELFKQLSDELEKLEFNKELHIELAGLSPNSSTILDVERVKELFDDENSSVVSVKLPNNKTIKIDRSIISILTKEVILRVDSKFETNSPRAFMNHSDVLDFPGSKSREKIPLSVFNQNKTEEKLQLLVRGKVAYLFDTYTKNLGVSTLLYCTDDNPPEEKDAPHKLYKWVKKYVGESSEERDRTLIKTKELLANSGFKTDSVSPLFVVLTKFNQDINRVIPGKETSIETHDSKWFARIQENFVNFMKRPVEDKWPVEWSKHDKLFNHVFPVRDPMYSQATFSGYEQEEKEIAVRPERVEALKAMKMSFLGSEIVSKHILNPEKTWNEITRPNSSGIIGLSSKLNFSAHPSVTIAKLEIELDKIRKELLSVLSPHLISGDINKDLRAAKTQSAKAFTSLISMANTHRTLFTNLLSCLLISDIAVWNILYDYVFIKEETDEQPNNSDISGIESIRDLGVTLFEGISFTEIMDQLRSVYEGLDDDQINEIIKDIIQIDIQSLVDKFNSKPTNNVIDKMTEEIISFWMKKLIENSLENDFIGKLNETQKEIFRGIINEILKSRDRSNLSSYISNTISDIRQGSISAEDLDLVSSCVTTILNKFTFTSGWFLSEEDKKPLKDETSPIFSENAQDVVEIDTLNFKKGNTPKTFFKEWNKGIKSIYEENIRYDYNFSGAFNSARNEKLEKIISTLAN
jgi:hypothetical protein